MTTISEAAMTLTAAEAAEAHWVQSAHDFYQWERAVEDRQWLRHYALGLTGSWLDETFGLHVSSRRMRKALHDAFRREETLREVLFRTWGQPLAMGVTG